MREVGSFANKTINHYRFDVLVIPGGGSDPVLEGNLEPIPLIETFVEHQQANPARERTLMSICTGSLL